MYRDGIHQILEMITLMATHGRMVRLVRKIPYMDTSKKRTLLGEVHQPEVEHHRYLQTLSTKLRNSSGLDTL